MNSENLQPTEHQDATLENLPEQEQAPVTEQAPEPEQEQVPEPVTEQAPEPEQVQPAQPKETSVLEKILATTKEELDSMDLSAYRNRPNTPVQWFFGNAGEEHYRLLIKISTLFNGQTLYDIGTYEGSSALALAHNETNFVLSHDLVYNNIAQSLKKPNMNLLLGDVLNFDGGRGLLNSPFIMLDTSHDGSYEHRFYHFLKHNGYKGLLFLDDIFLNEPMRMFWDSITEPKYDLTNIGHFSGNGIVDFSKS
jgi:hypothetical protein